MLSQIQKIVKEIPKLKKWILSVKKRHDKFERLRSVKFDPSTNSWKIANHSWSVKQMRRLISRLEMVILSNSVHPSSETRNARHTRSSENTKGW